MFNIRQAPSHPSHRQSSGKQLTLSRSQAVRSSGVIPSSFLSDMPLDTILLWRDCAMNLMSQRQLTVIFPTFVTVLCCGDSDDGVMADGCAAAACIHERMGCA